MVGLMLDCNVTYVCFGVSACFLPGKQNTAGSIADGDCYVYVGGWSFSVWRGKMVGSMLDSNVTYVCFGVAACFLPGRQITAG